MPLKYLSICSGIEAATVAWHGFGWEPIAFSEIDKFPSAVLTAHYPDVPNLGDMTAYTEWPEEMLGEVDILVGGTPCQAFSVAGKRESLGDDRGNLSLVFCNLYHRINEIRRANGRPPAIVVWENVPGVLSTKDNAFGCFISGIMGLDEAIEPEKGKWHKAGFFSGEAFRVGYRVLDAQYFGVAQRRRRVFLVAVPRELIESLGERACPSEILSLRESMLGDPPTRGAAWQGFARATEASLTSSGRGVERPGESRGQDDVVVSCPAMARTLTQRMHKGFDSEDGSTHAIGCGSPGGCCTQAVAFKPGQSEAAGATFTTDEFLPTLQAHNNGSTAVPAVAFTAEQTPKFKQDCAFTVTKQSPSGGGQPQCVAFTKAKRAQSATDDESWVQGDVAPTQNQFDVGDTRATTVVAFKESQSGTRLGDVHATIDSNKGSRRQEGVVACNIYGGSKRKDRPDGGFYVEAAPNASKTLDSSGGLNPAASQGGTVAFCTPAMQVRRLTPTECEFLQGFPAGYTDVVYRNKPAADGPRYRALGNSMAVPCMWWVGFRLRSAILEVPN